MVDDVGEFGDPGKLVRIASTLRLARWSRLMGLAGSTSLAKLAM